jgi:SPP1 family predicted phage head-tail adaptor
MTATRCTDHYTKRCEIQRPVGTADAHGHVDSTADANWQRVTTAFCSCVSKGGREFWKVQQVNADVSHVWRTPYSKTIAECTPDMRLICEGKTYEILSVIDIDEEHRHVEIQTRRKVQ